MDLDADGEDEVPAPPPAAGSNTNSLKRAGDDLAGPDEKRAREQNGSAAPPASPAASAPAPGSAPYPAGANGGAPANPAIAYVPINYQPPAPRNPGPRTKLTQTQHKHLLGAVRNIKRMAPQVSAFLAPVDTVLYGIPHYFKVVKSQWTWAPSRPSSLLQTPAARQRIRARWATGTRARVHMGAWQM